MPPYHCLDIQILFFQDVANQPIIKGKEEYTPLLRRIQSKTFFNEIFGEGQEISGITLWKTTQKYIDQLNSQLTEYQIPIISNDELRREVDSFVNDPNQDFPSSLGRVFQNSPIPKDQQARVTELAWKCFYLITLFPAGSQSIDNLPEIDEFMKQTLQEAEEARRQLLAGTIRFITGIAQAREDDGIVKNFTCMVDVPDRSLEYFQCHTAKEQAECLLICNMDAAKCPFTQLL